MTDTIETAVSLSGITKRFGDVIANDDVDMAVERGTVHALLGENGAGKTTLMNVLYGLYEPTAGEVRVDGDVVEFDSPQDAIAAGVGMIHQHFMLVEPMTVRENIALGWEPVAHGGLKTDDARIDREVRELSERYGLGLAGDLGTPVEQLSMGARQRAEVLKTLFRGADLFVFDEPTAVLTPQEVEELFGIFEQLTAQGGTIIFITHKLGEALTAADEITVLRDGRRVDTVDAADTSREKLAEMMVGREVLLDVDRAARGGTGGDVGLAVEGLTVEDDRGEQAVHGVDLDVHEGEVVGIAGVDGNGQGPLVEAVTGVREAEAGTVRFGGEDVTGCSRRERLSRGLAHVPSDRQEQALVLEFDLVANAILGSQHREPFGNRGSIDWAAARDHAAAIIEEYDVRPPNPDATARSLSGGNQQKFVVGRELSRDPDVVVAAHPTRGVDIGSKEFIHEQLLAVRDRGVPVLVVSASLDEVLGLSDRVAVMYEGEFVDVVDPDAATEEQLGLLMAGERPEGLAEAGR
jgi:simple sugar transport system ATP-binding protein